MRSKRHIRKVLWVAAALGLVTGLLLALVQLPWVERAAWQLVRREARSAYGVLLSGSDFRYSPLRFAFEIDDFTLGFNEASSAPVLAADSVALDIAFWRSVLDMPTIEDGRIEGARIVLRGGPGTDAPSPGSVETFRSETGLALPVRIDSFEVQGEALVLGEASSPLRVTAERWRLEARRDGGSQRVTLEVDRARIENPYADLELAPLASTVEVSAGGIRIESLEALSQTGSLSLQGTLGDFTDPVLDLEATLRTPLEAVLPGLGEGFVTTRTEIRNRIADLTVSARSRGEGLRAGPLADVAIDAPWTWTRRENRVSVAGLRLETPIGGAELSGEVGLDAAGPGRASVAVTDLDLSRVAELIASPILPASRASGTFDGSWESLEWQRVSGSGRLELTSTRASVGPHTLPLSGALGFGVGGGGISLETAGLAAGPLTLRGDMEMDRSGGVAGQMTVAARDVAGAADAVSLFLGRPIEPRTLPYPEGPAEATLSLSGAWRDPEARFALTAPRLRFGRFVDLSLDGEGTYRSGRIGLDSFSLASGGEQVRARGTLDLAASPLALSLEAAGSRVSLETVLAGLGADELRASFAGRFDVESRIEGPITDLQVSGQIDGSRVSAYGVELGEVGAGVRWDGEELEVAELLLRGSLGDPGGIANGALRYRPDSGTYALRIEGSGFSVESLTPGETHASGSADFVLEGEGSLDEPRGWIDLEVANGAYGPLDLGQIALDGSVADRMLEVALRLPGRGLTADAEIALDGDWPTSIRLAMEDLDLAWVEPLIPERLRPLSGRLRGTLEASGQIPRWRDGAFRMDLAATEARIGETEFATVGTTVLHYADGRFRLEPVVVLTDGQRLTASGDLPVTASGEPGLIHVEGALDVGTLIPTLLPGAGLETAGFANVDLQLTGSFGNIRPTLTATLQGGLLAAPWMPDPLTGIEADLAVSDGTLEIERLDANWKGARIDASGSTPLGLLSEAFGAPVPGAGARLEARLSGVDLAAIPGMPAQVTGRAEGRLMLEADALSLDAVEGGIVLDTLEASFGGVDFEQEAPTAAAVSNGRVELEPFRIRGPSTALAGSGAFGLRPTDPVRLDVSGRTDTVAFFSGAGGVESTGSLAIDLRLRGTLRDPSPTGELQLSDVTLSLQSPTTVVVSDLDARLQLDPESVVLESATGTINGGTIDVRGSVGHRGGAITDGSIEVRLAEVFAEVPEGLTTLSDVDLRIASAEDEVIQIGGNVRILEGAYTRDIELAVLLLEYVGSGVEGELLTEPDPTLSRIRYEVSIDTLEPLVIDNNIARAEADVNLQLVGSYYRPGLVGRVAGRQGLEP